MHIILSKTMSNLKKKKKKKHYDTNSHTKKTEE